MSGTINMVKTMTRKIIGPKVVSIDFTFLNNNGVRLHSIYNYIHKFVLPPTLVRESCYSG